DNVSKKKLQLSGTVQTLGIEIGKSDPAWSKTGYIGVVLRTAYLVWCRYAVMVHGGVDNCRIDLTGKISSSGGGTGTSGFDSYSLHGLSDSGNEGKNTESRRSKNGNRKGDRGVNENKDAGASDPATDTGADITPPSSQKAREQKTEQSSRKRGRGGLGNAMVEAIEISSEYDEEKTDEEEHSVTGAAPGKGKGKEKGKGSSTGEGGRRLPPASTKAKDDAKERHFDGDQEARGEGVEEEKADAV
ncbi:unnamed protein product, partial [Discosporangium mesarthrocarpum]